jgi:hypothetical protein
VQKVECMAVDPTSNSVFTGHADGSIRVHRIKHAATDAAELDCNLTAATCCAGVAVRSLAIEVQATQPRCWAGDAQGCVSVHQLTTLQDSRQFQLLTKKTGEGHVLLLVHPSHPVKDPAADMQHT